MLVILEGLDGVGKTTIADALGFDAYFHSDKPKPDLFYEHALPLINYLPGRGATGKHVVCDRWHLSECVYAVTRRNQTPSEFEFRAIERYLAEKGALLVYVSAPMPDVYRALEERGEDYNREQLERERSEWEFRLARSRLPLLTIGRQWLEQSFTGPVCEIVRRARLEESIAVSR